jgi:Holliday junction resolvase
MKPEEAIVAKIKKHLIKRGFWVIKLTQVGAYQQAGLPDLLAIKAGKAYFFEVKTETGVVSKLQTHTIEVLRGFGAVAEVVRSVVEVETILTRHNA